jgi:hypothetical protein
MVRTLTPEQKQQSRQLKDEIQAMSEEILQDVAELLSGTPDEELFGDTEFIVRQKVLKIVATAFTAHLAQKKTAMSAPALTVPTASNPPASTVSVPASH